MPWIAVGLLLAALAEPMLSHTAFKGIPSFLQVPLAALIGVPVYVVPLARRRLQRSRFIKDYRVVQR